MTSGDSSLLAGRQSYFYIAQVCRCIATGPCCRLEKITIPTLNNCRNISDLRKCAKRKLPVLMFHYIDGGADDEWSKRRGTEVFDNYELLPNYFKDIETIDLETPGVGNRAGSPILPVTDRYIANVLSREGAGGLSFRPQVRHPLSLRKSAIVFKSGIRRPVNHINSTLRCVSRSRRRLD